MNFPVLKSSSTQYLRRLSHLTEDALFMAVLMFSFTSSHHPTLSPSGPELRLCFCLCVASSSNHSGSVLESRQKEGFLNTLTPNQGLWECRERLQGHRNLKRKCHSLPVLSVSLDIPLCLGRCESSSGFGPVWVSEPKEGK